MSKPDDDSVYTPDNIPLYEALYGKNLISLGGYDAIENMFSDINLTPGLKLLDIGFGIGGVAYYLAKTKHTEVSGVEIHPWMAQYAQQHAPNNISSLLHFDVYDHSGQIPYNENSFDLAYSKGVLNHVKEKKVLFEKINQVLKDKGLFVIADWIYPSHDEDEPSYLVKESKESYENILVESGFEDIKFRDDSIIFHAYVDKFLANLASTRQFIEDKYGKDLFTIILNDHQKLIEEIQNKNKFAVRITARKK